jgi:hypothetical protein
MIVRIVGWLIGQGCRHGWRHLRARRTVTAINQRRDALERLGSARNAPRARDRGDSRTL